MASIPTEHSGMVRYELDTGTRHVTNFGTLTKNTPGMIPVYSTEYTPLEISMVRLLSQGGALRLIYRLSL